MQIGANVWGRCCSPCLHYVNEVIRASGEGRDPRVTRAVTYVEPIKTFLHAETRQPFQKSPSEIKRM